MGTLCRIGIALDSELLRRFDHSIELRGYTNRSEAFRDLIRGRLVRKAVLAELVSPACFSRAGGFKLQVQHFRNRR